MPFKSKKQARFMFAKHPNIAKKWTREAGGKVKISKKGGKRGKR